MIQLLFDIQTNKNTYLSVIDGKNSSVPVAYIDKLRSGWFKESCQYKKSCTLSFKDLDIPKVPKQKGPYALKEASLKFTCVSIITKEKYNMIYWFYSVANPLVLIFFIIFIDNLDLFQKRFIQEF